MTGLSNYSAQNLLNYLVGAAAMPALPASEWLALFTAVGNDSGSGMVEPGSGTGYLRAQIAGSLSTTSGSASGSAVLHITGLPAWIQVGMLVTDTTTPASIPVSSYVIAKDASSVTVSNILLAVASGDSIRFTSFGPAVTGATYSLVNGAPITFPQASAPGYTCPAFGIFDASGGGNMLTWDFFGLYDWGPFSSASGASGSGAVFNQAGNGLSNGNGVIVSSEFGGTLPTTTQGTLSGYALNYAANVSGDSYTLSSSSGAPSSGNAVWTSNAGGGQARRVAPVVVPPGVQETIPASGIYLSTYVSPAPPALLPLDLVSGAAAAYSTRKLRTAYTGAALNTRRDHGDDLLDIGFVDGVFDAATFTTFITGGSGFNADWYDQSGNAANALQATNGLQPLVMSDLSFYGSNTTDGSTQVLAAPNAAAIQDIFATGGFAQIVLHCSSSASVGSIISKSKWVLYCFGSPSTLWFYIMGSGGDGFWGTTDTVSAGAKHVITVAYDASTPAVDAVITLDGVTCNIGTVNDPGGTILSDAAFPLELANNFTISSNDKGLGGTIYEAILYKRTVSGPDQVTLIDNAKAYYGIP